jgi:hypothetical protein
MVGGCLMGLYLTRLYLMGVHLIGVFLMGVHLTNVYFMDLYIPNFPLYKRWSIYRDLSCKMLVLRYRALAHPIASVG